MQSRMKEPSRKGVASRLAPCLAQAVARLPSKRRQSERRPTFQGLRFFGERWTPRRQRVNNRSAPPAPRPGAFGRGWERAHPGTGRAADLETLVWCTTGCASHPAVCDNID